jgi:hypothetical protein
MKIHSEKILYKYKLIPLKQKGIVLVICGSKDFKVAKDGEIKSDNKSLQKMRLRNEQKTLEIFQVRLEEIINKAHPLVRFSMINWKYLEEKLSEKYTEKQERQAKRYN